MLSKAEKLISLESATAWLAKSIDFNDGNGSSAYLDLWNGWSGPYPETTGYIIPTLFAASPYVSDKNLQSTALKLADWLLSLQRSDGSFPQGLEMGEKSEIFDSGQILFGLLSAFHNTNEEKYKTAFILLIDWMISNQTPDGAFSMTTYVAQYCPSYHVRFVWALVLSLEIYPAKQQLSNVIHKALQYYSSLILENAGIKNWGFHPHEPGLTHTIAYTLRGFIECGILLKEKKFVDLVIPTINKIENDLDEHKFLAGEYDTDWKGNYSFRCLTGEAQLSIIYRRLYKLYNDEKYERVADKLLLQISTKQNRFPYLKNMKGGFFASAPFYGKYMRFRMNNWTCKFYIDALLLSLNPDMDLFG